jgi:hypothetical protein
VKSIPPHEIVGNGLGPDRRTLLRILQNLWEEAAE